MSRIARVEITVLNTRPLGQIIDDGFNDRNVVIDERNPFVYTTTSKGRDSGKAKTSGSNNLSLTVGLDFYLFLL